MFRRSKKGRSIFCCLIVSMCVLVVIEVTILAATVSGGGIFDRLDQNAKDILRQKVINRGSYLQNEMLNKWSAMDGLVKEINAAADRLAAEGRISFDELDQDSQKAEPLVLELADDLVEALRMQQVTGAYVIFNTRDLEEGLADKPGLYLRDMDPRTKASLDNSDILLERASAEVVKKLDIATSASWRPQFEFKNKNQEYYDFFYTPYEQAMHNKEGYSVSDMGYWGGRVQLADSDYTMITYSMPLINGQGKVYGVAGVDISLEQLGKLLPDEELLDIGTRGYLLAVDHGRKLELEPIAAYGMFSEGDVPGQSQKILLQNNGEDLYIEDGDTAYYAAPRYLKIYNNNTPYSDQHWVILGLADEADLLVFTANIRQLLLLAILLTFAVGIGGSIFASYMLARPVRRLRDQVAKADIKRENHFDRTHIREIDSLADTMEMLQKNILDTASKFTNILQMASMKLAGFEYNEKTGELFVSENFFEVLLDDTVDTESMTIKDFQKQFAAYAKYIMSADYGRSRYLYRIPNGDDDVYVSLRLLIRGSVYSGIVENVTQTVVERNVIEYERDHDALTDLLNRGAFIRIMTELFRDQTQKLKIAALLMLDLDNLKFMNDNYGHEAGDSYITRAAEIFKHSVPEDTIVSRISGDEFFLFFYGYETEEEISEKIQVLREALKEATVRLAEREFPVKASGGIAWYPRDSKSFEKLQQFADYAMYTIKRSNKGDLTEFDVNAYLKDSLKKENRDELQTLIRNKALQFCFQPIISGRDGEIFAYEALMRSFMPTLKSPGDILQIAREENCLGDIEELTWERSMESFSAHRDNQLVGSDTRLFVNSLPSQILSEDKLRELEKKHGAFLQNVVMEVTEVESMNVDYQKQKARIMQRWNADLALDDYGSGYNSEKLLLSIAPAFIKVDMNIIRDIDSSPDKCKIVENIVGYAHERNMKVIAEGIETIEELKQVIALQVDYLQGYLFAKPQYLPPQIPENIVELIRFLNSEK